MSDWRSVGPAEAIPEDEPMGVEFEVDGRRLELVVVHRQGRFYALGGRCTHRGAPLGELGMIHPEDGTLLCRWHYWAFRLEDGAQTQVEGMGLGAWPTRLREGVLQIDVSATPRR